MNNKNLERLRLINGRVFGGENGPPEVFSNILIEGGRVVAIEDNPHWEIHDCQIVDLKGDWVFPGMCDAHLHMAAGGQSLGITNLSGLDRSQIKKAISDRIGTSESNSADWFEAFNWDETPDSRLDAAFLESVVRNRPAIIHKRDLHGCCCNQTALKIAGINSASIDPADGSIGRNFDGTPNGMLYESAIGLLHRHKPAPDANARKRFILNAQDYLVRLGITAVSEVLDADNDEIYREFDATGKLLIDVDGWLRFEHWDKASHPWEGDRYRVGTLKLFLDGSFGSRTAAMSSPFSNGLPSGSLIYSDNDLTSILELGRRAGWRFAIHAIGDLAVEQACRVLRKIDAQEVYFARIEHFQQLPDDGIRLVKESRAIASIQPIHLLDDQNWLPDLIGKDRCRNSFIWKSLFENGVELAIGSDWPVASPDPKLGLHAAINRANFGMKPNYLFGLDEALLPWQALRAVSRGYAVASGRFRERGAITIGRNADLTIVSGLDETMNDWSNATTRMTITRGEIVWEGQ